MSIPPVYPTETISSTLDVLFRARYGSESMPFTVSVIDPPLRTYVVGTYESEGTAVDVASSGSLNVGGGESRVTEHVTGVVLAIFRRTIVAPEDWGMELD